MDLMRVLQETVLMLGIACAVATRLIVSCFFAFDRNGFAMCCFQRVLWRTRRQLLPCHGTADPLLAFYLRKPAEWSMQDQLVSLCRYLRCSDAGCHLLLGLHVLSSGADSRQRLKRRSITLLCQASVSLKSSTARYRPTRVFDL